MRNEKQMLKPKPRRDSKSHSSTQLKEQTNKGTTVSEWTNEWVKSEWKIGE